MKAPHNNVALQRDILTRAKRAHGPTTIPDTYNYYIFGGISAAANIALSSLQITLQTMMP